MLWLLPNRAIRAAPATPWLYYPRDGGCERADGRIARVRTGGVPV